MNSKMKTILKSAFNVPQPTRKEEFLNSLSYPKATTYEFFLSQLWYIRKRFWCLSLLLFVGMTIFSTQLKHGSEIICFISTVLPLLTLLTITEIGKSMSFHMGELEDSCRFNLSKITLIRLSIIGFFHFVILLLVLFIFKDNSQYGLLRYALYAVTPFLLSSYLSFWITNHFRTKDATYICGGVTIFISLLIFMLNSNHTVLYNPDYTIIWAVAFIIIFILLIKEIYFLLNERIGQWNFA